MTQGGPWGKLSAAPAVGGVVEKGQAASHRLGGSGVWFQKSAAEPPPWLLHLSAGIHSVNKHSPAPTVCVAEKHMKAARRASVPRLRIRPPAFLCGVAVPRTPAPPFLSKPRTTGLRGPCHWGSRCCWLWLGGGQSPGAGGREEGPHSLPDAPSARSWLWRQHSTTFASVSWSLFLGLPAPGRVLITPRDHVQARRKAHTFKALSEAHGVMKTKTQ